MLDKMVDEVTPSSLSTVSSSVNKSWPTSSDVLMVTAPKMPRLIMASIMFKGQVLKDQQ